MSDDDAEEEDGLLFQLKTTFSLAKHHKSWDYWLRTWHNIHEECQEANARQNRMPSSKSDPWAVDSILARHFDSPKTKVRHTIQEIASERTCLKLDPIWNQTSLRKEDEWNLVGMRWVMRTEPLMRRWWARRNHFHRIRCAIVMTFFNVFRAHED